MGSTRNFGETRIVFKYGVARRLANDGFRIVDIRPQKNKQTGETDFSRCMFVFQYEDGLDEKITELTKR